MSIRAQAAAGTAAAFAAADDAKVAITLRLGPTEGAYDPATDATTTTWEQNDADIEAIPYADKTMKETTPLELRTRSFIVQGTSVTANDPNQSGEIVDEDSKLWQIARAEKDPTGAVWIFHCTG